MVGGKWKSDLEARWDALGAGHRNEQRVEVRAVALLRVAGVKNVAAAPTRARFVVTQRREDVVVDRARFFEGSSLALSNLRRQIGGQSGHGNENVGLQVLLLFLR